MSEQTFLYATSKKRLSHEIRDCSQYWRLDYWNTLQWEQMCVVFWQSLCDPWYRKRIMLEPEKERPEGYRSGLIFLRCYLLSPASFYGKMGNQFPWTRNKKPPMWNTIAGFVKGARLQTSRSELTEAIRATGADTTAQRESRSDWLPILSIQHSSLVKERIFFHFVEGFIFLKYR